MARNPGGSGRLLSARDLQARRKLLGLDLPPTVDLNQSPTPVLAAHSGIDKAVAARIVRWRRGREINTPADLYSAGVISAAQLRVLEHHSFGRLVIRPLITAISAEPERLFVDETFALRISFLTGAMFQPELVSLSVLFPSGTTGRADFTIGDEERRTGSLLIDGFVSVEPGELHVLATLRDAAGNVHQQAATVGVFTRNPVHLYTSPTYLTQSGNAGAPKFNFDERRWYCYTGVRWVNSTDGTVNLGRSVMVRMTDAGSEIGTFSFNLSSDIVIPPWTTIYGSMYTYHPEGTSAFDVFHSKGDLTFRYSMSGSGFSPTRNQIWRTMRVIGYNIIRVGDFSATERSEYQRAASEIASGIFQSRDMTVYGVELYRIEGTAEMDADKARFRFIDSQDEINELRNKYTVSNWYLDVFFVEGRWDGAFGSSPTDGPVDKQGNSSGLILRRDGDTINLGQTFAHEAGHYFGLEHADEDDGCSDTNPSAPNISDNFIYSSSRRDSTVITGCQIDKMRRHGLVRSMTP
jgi:hypothetical protein